MHLRSHVNQTPKMQITSFKIGMHFEIRKKIITAWEDIGNPPFHHILFTSVVISNCDKSVITEFHICDLGLQSPLFICRKEKLDGFQQCKGYFYLVMVPL